MKEPICIDTHSHVNFEKFSADAQEVIQRSVAAGTWMVNVGSQFPTSERAVMLAEVHGDGVFAGVGMHPTHAHDTPFDADAFLRLAGRPKCVAIGETGLDYFRLPEDVARHEEIKEKQTAILREHIRIAATLDKPLIVHCRCAYEDLIEILRAEAGNVKRRGVCHCFVADRSVAERFLELDFHLSFTGIMTFTDDEKLLDVARWAPLDRVMIETDAPYLTPVPLRGKRNEPLYVEHVARKIGELRGCSFEEVASATTATARQFFRI